MGYRLFDAGVVILGVVLPIALVIALAIKLWLS
jgi:hypothetical protein